MNQQHALTSAGIPPIYRKESSGFSSFPGVPAMLRDWCEGPEAKAWAAKEGGTVLVTQNGSGGTVALHTTYLIARALVLRSRPVHVTNLSTLATSWEAKDMSALENRKVLTIIGFNDSHWRAPMKDETAMGLEWFLRSWLNDERALLLHCQSSIRQDDCKWWSPNFRNMLAGCVKEVIV